MSGPRNRRPSPAIGARRPHSRPRSRGRCQVQCAAVLEPIASVTESEVIVTNGASEDVFEDIGCPSTADAETLENDTDELYECGVEFVGSLIQDLLDEEDFDNGEAHVVMEAPDAPIAEGDEYEEEDEDVCIHQVTTQDCFADSEEKEKSRATNLLLNALDDGRLEAAMKAASAKDAELKKVRSVLIAGLESGCLEESLKATQQNEAPEQKEEVTAITSVKQAAEEVAAQNLLINALDDGRLQAAMEAASQKEAQLEKAKLLTRSVLLEGLESGRLAEALSAVQKNATPKNEESTPPHVKVATLLLDALDNGSLETAIISAKQAEEQSVAASVKSTLEVALKNDSLEQAIKLAKQTEPEQKQEPKQEEQDLPRFNVRPAFRPENAFFFEMMCNLLDCSLDGVGRDMFPETEEEEAQDLSLPSTASLMPCTRRTFARRLVPTGPSAPVPAENFPMDCLPPLEQKPFAGVLSGPGVLPEVSASVFDPLCCQSAGHVIQGVQWFSPCRSGLQFPKEEALPCPELVNEKQKLGSDEAATRIQKAFHKFQAHAVHARYFAEIQKMQQLAAQLAAPVNSQGPVAPAEAKELSPMAPVAPKSPRRTRVRPSTTRELPGDVMSFPKESEMAHPVPQAPSSATPKSAPTRKRRSILPADMPIFRMDTDTEEAPTKQTTEDLAKEFMALDAELYSLDAPSRPVTPKAGLKSPRSSGAKPISALMLDLAEDSEQMRSACSDAATQQRERMQAVYSNATTSFSGAATSFTVAAPSKRTLSLGSKQGLQDGKVLPALTPRRSQALVESGNRMANQVSIASTPRGRYF